MKRWIWEQDEYPSFTYDIKKLDNLIQKVSRQQGYLIAISKVMDKENIAQSQLNALVSEAISTSAIEGEILNRDSVKASVQKKLGLSENKKEDIQTDYIVEILIDANTNYDSDLTLHRLFGWHNALFPTGYSGFTKINVADFRGDACMQIVSGTYSNEKVYYEAPPRKRLEYEMERLLEWFNATEASLLKAAIAHLWFVIIHPYEDGNGRIARAITDLVLSKIENSHISKLYSMSSAINADRNGYYYALENTTGYIKKDSGHLDITLWCEWFLKTLSTALKDTEKKLGYIIDKTKFWDNHKNSKLNARQIRVLNKILDMGVENFKGNLSKKKYIKIADTTSTTASRDIKELLELGCIKHVEGSSGKNTRYVVEV
jgi:Fic family protein